MGDGMTALSAVFVAVGVAALAYVAYLCFEQRESLVFAVGRPRAQLVVAAALVLAAAGNLVWSGPGVEQVATAMVLVAWALLMSAVRAGLGRSGIYADGLRRPWGRLDAVHVGRAGEGAGTGTRVRWSVGKATGELVLDGVEPREVADFVREMRRSHRA